METRLSSLLMIMILFTQPFNLKAQEYREASHANFNLEEDRVIPLDGSEFKFRKEWAGKQVFVRIPAIPVPSSVLINGFPFNIEPDTTGSTEINITPFLKEEDNIIDLPVACSLLIRDAIHIRDMVITQHPGPTENVSLVRVHLFLKSYLRETFRERSILLDLRDPDGQSLIQESRTLSTALSFGQETEFIFDLDLEKPSLWIPGTPKFYELIVSLENKGKQPAEVISSQFAFTSFWQNDTLLVADGDTIVLRYPSNAQSKSLLTLKEEEIKGLMEETSINAIRRETPLPCHLEALFQRCGIQVVSDSE